METNLTLVAMNIINKDNVIINKDGVPIILYTTTPEKTISELQDNTTEIGTLLFNFFINNIVDPLINKQIDNYVRTKIIYIYYNAESGETKQDSLLLEDIFKLTRNGNERIKQLYLYYIKASITNVCKQYKYMLNKNLIEKINNIKDESTVKELYNYLSNKNNNKFCQPFFVKAVKGDLEQTFGLSNHNVMNLLDILIQN